MASYKIEYGASSALTITLGSLATSSTLLAGRESTAVDNTTNKYLDYLLAGVIVSGTSPTVDTKIQIGVVGMIDDSTWPDVFDGTDSAETVTSAQVKNACVKVVWEITISATSNISYYFGPISVAAAFGGVMPKKFSVFVTQSTAQNLNAAGHAIYVTPIYATIA